MAISRTPRIQERSTPRRSVNGAPRRASPRWLRAWRRAFLLICGASPLACRAVPLPERPYRRYRWLIARLPVPHEHARTGDTTGSSVPKHLPRARAGPLARVVARAPTPVPAHDTRARKHVPISTGNRARNWRAPTRNSLHFRYRILFTLRRDGKRQENKKRAKVKVC